MPEHRNLTRRPQDLADGRILAAGEHTPPDFDPDADPHDARLVAEGVLAPVDRGTPGATPPAPYQGVTRDDLLIELDRRDLDVTGTGSGGYVTRDDLVAALQAADANPADPED